MSARLEAAAGHRMTRYPRSARPSAAEVWMPASSENHDTIDITKPGR